MKQNPNLSAFNRNSSENEVDQSKVDPAKMKYYEDLKAQ